ncbi:MAG: carbamoyltransferase HypF [Thermoleophilia bacterium]
MAVLPPPPRKDAARIEVRGTVQGVGFRPFIKRLADEHELSGTVRNTPWGVEVRARGSRDSLESFVREIRSRAPRLARIETVSVETVPLDETSAEDLDFGLPPNAIGFSIETSSADSSPGDGARTLVSPDVSTCPDCLAEVFSPHDRRYRYPFTTCINCGPRYTIIEELPYDRPRTTMKAFEMCPECLAEYNDPSSRRFHSQPNACAACGPELRYLALQAGRWQETAQAEAALTAAARLLRQGGILALKGLGGFHLACDARREDAVRVLRERKGRDERPFAVMGPDLDTLRSYCNLSPSEAELLTGISAPIVLLERRADAESPALAPSVAPDLDTYGFFLPYTPLHHLLLADLHRPLVMTSANLSDEPIVYRDREAESLLTRLADGILTHNRTIHARADDSVVRIYRDSVYPLRRGRGYAPEPIRLPGTAAPRAPLLALGGQQKNTFCLASGERAFVSPHVGDLDDVATLQALERESRHLARLFGLDPESLVCDLHPDYASTRFAERLAQERGLPLFRVQHHEAHVASVLADRRFEGRVVGVAFDGAGYGHDGSIWGGEFFAGSLEQGLERSSHLRPFLLPGGERAIREPWRTAFALLLQRLDSGLDPVPEESFDQESLAHLISLLPDRERWESLPWRQLVGPTLKGIGAPRTTSAGRLFDGISALLGLRHHANYEGQAAVLLEAAARRHFKSVGLPSAEDPPPAPPAAALSRCLEILPSEEAAGVFTCASDHVAPGKEAPRGPGPAGLLDPVLAEIISETPQDQIAAHFHHQLAWETAAVAGRLAEEHAADTVALGGGVFQNLLLLDLTVRRLEALGLTVLHHLQVPTNDGGLSLGQAALAAARTEAGSRPPRSGRGGDG